MSDKVKEALYGMPWNVLAQYGYTGQPVNALAPREIFDATPYAIRAYAGDELNGPPQPVNIDRDFYLDQPQQGDGSILKQGVDQVWPSHAFYNNLGVPPGAQERIGRIQAAGLSGLNALGFGLPLAALQRLAPGAAAQANSIMGAHPTETTVAGIGAAVANPANVGLRAAGNALAQRGYGLGTQAVADGLTMAGVSMAPNMISHGAPMTGENIGRSGTEDIPITTAVAARFLMPQLPASAVERALRGAQAGTLGASPGVMMGHDDPWKLASGAAYGAVHGAGLKRAGADSRDVDVATMISNSRARERWLDSLAIPGMVGGAKVGSVLFGGYDDEVPDTSRMMGPR